MSPVSPGVRNFCSPTVEVTELTDQREVGARVKSGNAVDHVWPFDLGGHHRQAEGERERQRRLEGVVDARHQDLVGSLQDLGLPQNKTTREL